MGLLSGAKGEEGRYLFRDPAEDHFQFFVFQKRGDIPAEGTQVRPFQPGMEQSNGFRVSPVFDPIDHLP
jgi:hypothetical protein